MFCELGQTHRLQLLCVDNDLRGEIDESHTSDLVNARHLRRRQPDQVATDVRKPLERGLPASERLAKRLEMKLPKATVLDLSRQEIVEGLAQLLLGLAVETFGFRGADGLVFCLRCNLLFPAFLVPVNEWLARVDDDHAVEFKRLSDKIVVPNDTVT